MKKQHDMRVFYNNSKIKFYLGDVRNFQSIDLAMRNVDFVFQAAALNKSLHVNFFQLRQH